jgi:hypothetical protein
MNAYLITSIVLGVIAILVRLGCMAWSDYPRTVTYSRGEDAFLLLVSLGFALWAWHLLS